MPLLALILLGFVSGATLSYAFAPYEYPWLVFPTMGLLFCLVIHCRDNFTAALIGYSFGLGLFGFGIGWLYISINLFGGVNLSGAYAITFLLVAFHALYPTLIAVLTRQVFKHSHGLIAALAFSGLWTLVEWSRTWILSGFPWLSLGYTQTDTLFMNLAPVFGVFGISFILVFIACLLSNLITSKNSEKLASLIFIGVLFCGGYWLKDHQWTTPIDKKYSVALIQGAIPQEEKWRQEQRQPTIDLYLSLSKPYWQGDLVIWPETALPFFYQDQLSFIKELSNKVESEHAELLTGIPYSDGDTKKYYNSVVSLGQSKGIYLKRHLVPFGEYLPLDSLIRPLLHSMGISMANFSAAENDKPLIQISDVPVGISICFEDVFGEEVIDALPEAKILVNVSNDAWFGDSAAPHQHLQMARMRARETGRYLLRATNTGVSAIIDERGGIVSQSPQFKAHALAGDAILFEGMTPYAQSGNYPVVIFCSILLIICFIKRNSDKK